jgi:putative hydrolase of the HAD superfamily
MGGLSIPRALLLDALGTLVVLHPPAPRLRTQLRAGWGIDIDEQVAQRAMAEEIAFYREHHLEGGDRRGLARLRARCARVLGDALGPPAASLATDDLVRALLESLHFEPYPEVPAALRRLRGTGRRLVVVSNWDCSLHDVLERTGLAVSIDAAVSSAEVGAAKPDPRIFARALELAGVDAGDALHVGDSVREDLEGARAAGIAGALVSRDGSSSGAGVIGSLRELADLAP